jgi:hypothetical protein
MRTPSFFARKFDIRQDSRILDKLDELIDAEKHLTLKTSKTPA